MEQGVLEYERVREKKKQLLIKIQETKVGIRHKQNQLQLLEEGLKRIQEQEGSESIGGNLNIFLRDFSVILEAAVSTFLPPLTSSLPNNPYSSTFTIALREALNSTGSVTS